MRRYGPYLSRPYDVAFAPDRLAAVRKRREQPTGERHQVVTRLRGDREVYVYPWDAMELGDFFIVRIAGNSERSMRVAFQQLANRRDWELIIAKWNDKGVPSLRVTLTVIGLKSVKQAAARNHGVKDLLYSDGHWRKRRLKRRSDPRQTKTTGVFDPFFAADDPALPEFKAPPDPTAASGYVTAAERKRRLLAGEEA